jgi:integrase
MKDTTVRANRSRDFFITREVADQVLDACPDLEWRLLFSLSRYGGLRCPSEHLLLTWNAIDWARDRIIVRSPKTEHHEGKESREIPLFPELKSLLDEAYDAAPDGAVHVFQRYRDTNQNLRASRETELAAEYPAHVVAAWMGHSVIVSAKHYLQVTDSDFDKAVQETARKHGKNRGFPDSKVAGAGLEPARE